MLGGGCWLVGGGWWTVGLHPPCPPPPQAGSRHSRPRPHRPTRRCSAYSPAKLKIQRNITVKYTKAHKHMHTTCSLPRQKFLPLLISYLFSLFHLGALTHTLSQPCYLLAPNLTLFSTCVFWSPHLCVKCRRKVTQRSLPGGV